MRMNGSGQVEDQTSFFEQPWSLNQGLILAVQCSVSTVDSAIMPVDRRKAAVFGGALALRLLLLLLFPSLPDLLTGRVEVSTPVTSFKRRKSPLSLPIIWGLG